MKGKTIHQTQRITELERQVKDAIKSFASMSENFDKMKDVAKGFRECCERMQEREREFNKLPWYKKMFHNFNV